MRILTVLLLILVYRATGFCDEAAARPVAGDRNDQDLAAKVKRLMRDLDADRLTVRRAAQQRLLKLGPQILPYLPPPELISKSGVRRAVAELRIHLQRLKARASIEPSRVTVAGRQTLAELFSTITTQTGNRIDAERLSATVRHRSVNLTLQQEPFWGAMDRLILQAGLRYDFDEMADEIRLSLRKTDAGAAREVAVTHAGPFRVAIESVKWRERYQDLRLVLGIAAEPRLRPLFLKYAAADITGKTASGQKLSPKNPDAQWELPLGEGGRYTQLRIDLSSAKGRVENFELQGRFTVTTAAGEEQIRFTDLQNATGVARRRGGVTVKLVSAKSKKHDDGTHDFTIRAAVTYDARGPAFESHRTWIFHNKVFLVAKTGERIEFVGGQQTSLSRDGAVLIEYPFRNLKHSLAAYRFVYVAPTLILDVPVKFEFKQVGATGRSESN